MERFGEGMRVFGTSDRSEGEMTVINLDQFHVSLDYDKDKLRTEYRHMHGAVEEVCIFQCTCKVVRIYHHIEPGNKCYDMGMGACNVKGCRGYQGGMSSSEYVFSCHDHLVESDKISNGVKEE